MNPALAAVLGRADIWRGSDIAVAPAPTFPTGFPALDAELPGSGWPRGQLTELLAPAPGIGELALLLPVLARVTAAGDTVVLIAPPFVPHAPAWAAAGIVLERLRLVFPENSRDALWAGVEALRCKGVAATLLWLDALPRKGADRHRLPTNSLRRLQVAAGEGGGSAFLCRPAVHAAESSPAPLRLQLEAAGTHLRVGFLKRRGPPARAPLLLPIPRPARLKHADHVVAPTPLVRPLPAASQREFLSA